jgi:hypothetical protein
VACSHHLRPLDRLFLKEKMMQRRLFLGATGCLLLPAAYAHHGWSSFDQNRPVFLAGKAANVAWRNPHVEMDLAVAPGLVLPANLASRPIPAQSASVDGARLLASAEVPRRKDPMWHLEFAPLSRMRAWSIPEVKDGDELSVLGFTFADEKGDALMRVEYLWLGDQAYGLRSSPA